MRHSREHQDVEKRINPLLAEGFRNVDQQSPDEQQRCVQCLAFIKAHPGFLAVRDVAFEKLDLGTPNLVVYDVGCGAGFDTLEIARRIGEGGRVIGIDMSEALINEARGRAASAAVGLPAEFAVGDARTLTTNGTVKPGSADRLYMERALQHVPRGDFGDVLREYHAALKPGGTFVSVEPNWELFTVRSKHIDTTRAIHHHWTDRFNHSNVAMNLPIGMRDVGFGEVVQELMPVVFRVFEEAELVYDVSRTVGEAVSRSVLTVDQGADWLAEQRAAGDNFYCCLMMAITTGRKN